MIYDILELSKSEDERQNVNYENIELAGFVNEELSSFEYLIEERRLSVALSGDLNVKTDRKMLKSLIDNLLSNALKYATEDSEVTIDIGDAEISVVSDNADRNGRIKRRGRKQASILSYKRIIITNKIPEPIDRTSEELAKPYVKGDNSRGGRNGSGVGLAIVENMAKKLKFKVSYEITDEEFSVSITM